MKKDKRKTEVKAVHNINLSLNSNDGKEISVPVTTNVWQHKVFKPYNKVIVRAKNKKGKTIWIPMIYGMFDSISYTHILVNGMSIKDEDIKLYRPDVFKKWYRKYSDENAEQQ